MHPYKKPLAQQAIIPEFLCSMLDDEDKALIIKAFVKLLHGTYGGDYEKIAPHVYSMRLQGTARILVATVVRGDVVTAVLIECLMRHQYARSRCLTEFNRQQLTHHISKCAAGQSYVLSKDGVGLTEKVDAAGAQATPLPFIEYGGRYIEATAAQSDVLPREVGVTEVIVGEAGSGKTLVLMHRIVELASLLATDSSVDESSRCTIWVVVPYEPLKLHFEQEWERQSAFAAIRTQQLFNPVKIVTPDTFYRHLDEIPAAMESKNIHDFVRWLSHNNLQTMGEKFGLISEVQVYQELCLFHNLGLLHGGIEKAEELYTCPELNQAFLECADRQSAVMALAALLKSYQSYLAETNGFDPYLYTPRNKISQRDYVFADEVQNLPPGLLNVPRLLMAMNDSQSIFFQRRAIEIVLSHFFKKQLVYKRLLSTHRCPQQPIQLAARIDEFVAKYVNPGRKHSITSHTLNTSNPERGAVCFVDGHSDEELTVLRNMVKEPGVAVVYLTPQAEEEFRLLGISPLCPFNPDNPILGLEFERVILVSPFNASLANLYQKKRPYGELTRNQITEYERYLHAVKMAMTRSTNTLVVFQRNSHETNALISLFKESVHCFPLQRLNLSDEERSEELYQQACRMYRDGQHKIAFGILEYLQRNIDDFLQEMGRATHDKSPSISLGVHTRDAVSVASRKKSQEPIDTIPVAVAAAAVALPVARSALGEKELNVYVERVLVSRTISDFKELLSYSNAGFMLFQHKMKNGHCLFVNMVFDNALQPLIDIIESNDMPESVALSHAVSEIHQQDYFLRFALSELKSTKKADHSPLKSKILTLPEIKKLGFGCLFESRTTEQNQEVVWYIVEKPNVNLTIDDITHQHLRENGRLGPSLLHILALDPVRWVAFFKTKSTAIKSIFEKSFKCQLDPRNSDNTNVLILLTQTTDGVTWLFNNMGAVGPIMTGILFAPGISDGPDKGRTLFHCLCSSVRGIALLDKYWSTLKKRLSAEGLFAPVTGEGARKGVTPFHRLCSSPAGAAFIANRWDDFKKHLSTEGLFSPVTSECAEKGKTPFYYFCSTPSGPKFLANNWDDFEKHLSTEGLFSPVTGEGEYKGTTPFYCLCATDSGRILLEKQWKDFKKHISAEGLFAPVTGEGGDKGKTPFYYLCASPIEFKLLANNWDDFKKYLSAKGLFSPATGEGRNKGKTPFYYLCATDSGRSLLANRWDDFKKHISAEGLLAQVTGEGPDKGKTPFYYLCASRDGCNLLAADWDNFKKYLTREALFVPVTGEGPDKGKTPFSVLNSTGVGKLILELIELEFVDAGCGTQLSDLGLFATKQAGGEAEAKRQSFTLTPTLGS